MKYQAIHSFDSLSLVDMKTIQGELLTKCSEKTYGKKPEIVSAVDISYIDQGKTALVVIVSFDYESRKEIDVIHGFSEVRVPYRSGYLAFRELPPFLSLWEQLKVNPDIVFFDGQGRMHPRRMGIASHASCFINKPTVGIAKSHLIGTYSEPENKKGAFSYVYDKEEVVGLVLKTKINCKPVFISVGSDVSLNETLEWTLHFTDQYRIPQLTRIADLYTKKLKPQ